MYINYKRKIIGDEVAKLSDLFIKKHVTAGTRFTGLADDRCPGLYIAWPQKYSSPFWRYRYKIGGKDKAIGLGKYPHVGLSDARKIANEMRAKVTLGHDPVLEKKQLKAANKAAEDALKGQRSVSEITEEFMTRHVDGKLKRPLLIRQRLENHIKQSSIG